jgi:hypothetical protein
MSRNEKKIRKLAQELGIEIESIKWEPWGKAMEMCGPSGGWIVNEGEYVALSIGELLDAMKIQHEADTWYKDKWTNDGTQ